MKYRLKYIHPPTTPRLSITITLTIFAGLLAALAGLLGNLASTTLPDTIKPYLAYAWPALGVIVLLGIIVAAWQVWYSSGQPADDALSSASQSTVEGSNTLSHSTSAAPAMPRLATASSQQARQSEGVTTPMQANSGGMTPATTISPLSVPDATHYHTCVISYATADEPFVQKLSADLKAHGVPCWLADQDIGIGDKLRAEIYQAIGQLDKLLLVLSQHAIESQWVEEEVDAALDREHQQPGTYLLFPLRLDDTVFTASKYWAITVRQRRIGDFHCWEQDAEYQRALQRVLRDLRV